MLFRRLIYCSFLVGLCAGLISAVVQLSQVVPVIASAEVFEAMLPTESETNQQHSASEQTHSHDGHSHDSSHWSPDDGLERAFWTVLSNVLNSIGFALLLISAIISWGLVRRNNYVPSIPDGFLWGIAGWFCLFLWPALGLPPELPGEAAAGLHLRQAWWMLAVVCGAGGLGIITAGKGYWRWLGILVLALPFIVGAPHIEGPLFANHTAEAVVQLERLKLQFIMATALASAVQWLVLGVVSAIVIRRWIQPELGLSDEDDSESISTTRTTSL